MDQSNKFDTLLTRVGRAAADPATLKWLVAVYGVVALFFVFLLHLAPDMEAESDFFEGYVPEARAFLQGHIAIDDYRGPLYPMVLAVANAVLGLLGADFFLAGKLLSVICALGILLLVGRYLRKSAGTLAANGAVLLLAVNPTFLRYSYTASTDIFCAFLMVAAVVLWAGSEGKIRGIVLAAIAAALAYLTRYNSGALLAGLMLATVLVNPWRTPLRRRLVQAGVIAGVTALTILPWSLHLLAVKGHLFYNKNYANLVYTYYAPQHGGEDFLRSHGRQIQGYWDFLVFDTATLVRKVPSNMVTSLVRFGLEVLLWPAVVLAVVGLKQLFARPRDRVAVGVHLTAAVVMMLLTLVFFATRFYLLVLPFALMLAVQGAARLHESLQGQDGGRQRARRLTALGTVFVLAFSTVSAAGHTRRHLKNSMPETQQFAEKFLLNTPEVLRVGQRVAAHKPYFAYYAGLEFVRIPAGVDHNRFIKFLHERDIRYVYFSDLAARVRPELEHLLENHNTHPGLRPMATSSLGVLYEVVGVARTRENR